MENAMNSNFGRKILEYKHFVKFLMIGSLNTVIDLLLFFVFANILGINAVVASIFSTGITMCFSFFVNHRFVFRSSKRKRDTVGQFIAVTLFNVWVIQSLVISLVIHLLRTQFFFLEHKWSLNLLAKLAGVSISFILNFFMYRYIFHKPLGREVVA